MTYNQYLEERATKAAERRDFFFMISDEFNNMKVGRKEPLIIFIQNYYFKIYKQHNTMVSVFGYDMTCRELVNVIDEMLTKLEKEVSK